MLSPVDAASAAFCAAMLACCAAAAASFAACAASWAALEAFSAAVVAWLVSAEPHPTERSRTPTTTVVQSARPVFPIVCLTENRDATELNLYILSSYVDTNSLT